MAGVRIQKLDDCEFFLFRLWGGEKKTKKYYFVCLRITYVQKNISPGEIDCSWLWRRC